tara:strand:+ start:1610 stop:3841 length:2232 start_codon:yes stop_codon:yes gene_type:complete
MPKVNSKLRRLVKFFLIIFLSVVICCITFMAILLLGGFGKIPSKAELNSIQNESASLIYSEEGTLIGKFYAQNRTNTVYDSLPQHLINALIATEDARFFEHDGLDKISLLRVLFKTVLIGDKSSGGGSTLSQQLAKNLYGRKDYGKITILINKIKEIILARRIENNYSKEAIIQLYLNTVPFGENLYGIESASQRFFDATTSKLKLEESAVLIGLLKANSYYNPRLHPDHALNRRQVVIRQMEKYAYITEKESDSLQALPLTLNYKNLSANNPAPYFLRKVKKDAEIILAEYNQSREKAYQLERDGLIIKTSLNLSLQQAAQEAMKKQLSKMQLLLRKQYQQSSQQRKLLELATKIARQESLSIENTKKKKRFVFQWDEVEELPEMSVLDSLKYVLTQLQSGVLGINPQSGAIKAWLGGIDFQTNPYDQILAKRQLASTFKPILYATAFESGVQLCDYLSNESIVLTDYEDWTPSNYDGESGGKYSVAASLAYSKNIPTLHLYFQVGIEKLQETWSKLGFIEELNQEPSVILGTNSVSMLELAIAYSSFANLGYLVEPYSIESIASSDGIIIFQREKRKKERVLEEETCLAVNEALSMAIREGTGTALPYRYGVRSAWAGKTGTSQDYADAWFVGYNKEIVLVSRVGAAYPSIHFSNGAYGSGSALALPIIGECLRNSRNQKWINAGLAHSDDIDCENFKELSGVGKFLNSFKKSETTLEKEQKKAERKQKKKGFFKKLFDGE